MSEVKIRGEAPVSRVGLWFSLLGGALAWLAHLVFAYVIGEFGCVGGLGERAWLGLSAVAWMVLALTAVTAAVAAAATYVGWLGAGGLVEDEEGAGGAGAVRALAWAGVVTSGLFALTIVVEGVPIFYYLQTC